jgi:hypothetical protein
LIINKVVVVAFSKKKDKILQRIMYARSNRTMHKYKVEGFHVPPQGFGDGDKHEQNQKFNIKERRRIMEKSN